MKNFTMNKIILIITIFILMFLFIEHIINFDSVSSDILRYASIISMPMGLGFIFAFPFIKIARKINQEKMLKHILLLSFIFLLLLFIYHLIYTYTNSLKNFYGFFDFEQFLYYYQYKGLFPFGQFFIDIFTFFLMVNASFIGFVSGFIFNVYSEIYKIEKKKRE